MSRATKWARASDASVEMVQVEEEKEKEGGG